MATTIPLTAPPARQTTMAPRLTASVAPTTAAAATTATAIRRHRPTPTTTHHPIPTATTTAATTSSPRALAATAEATTTIMATTKASTAQDLRHPTGTTSRIRALRAAVVALVGWARCWVAGRPTARARGAATSHSPTRSSMAPQTMPRKNGKQSAYTTACWIWVRTKEWAWTSNSAGILKYSC
jgi:hypothetical protein